MSFTHNMKSGLTHLQDDGSRIVCRLKQTCTPTGADRKWATTVTDVMMLYYAVGLDVARDETQS